MTIIAAIFKHRVTVTHFVPSMLVIFLEYLDTVYVSTMSVFESHTYPDGFVIAENTVPSHEAGLSTGYAQSKWVAEKMMFAARERGIPVNIFRPGMITGDSRTGAFNTADFISAIIKTMVDTGSAPELSLPINLAPVDFVSQAIVGLSLANKPANGIYHIINPTPLAFGDLIGLINACGYPLATIPPREWLDKVTQCVSAVNEKHPIHSFLPLLKEGYADQTFIPKTIITCESTRQLLKDQNISCPAIDRRLMNTYLNCYLKKGFIA